MVPTITAGCDDSVLPGFERIALRVNDVVEDCLVRDLTESPAVQALVDDEGGEPTWRGILHRLRNDLEAEPHGFHVEALA